MRSIIRFETKKWLFNKAAWFTLIIWIVLIIVASYNRNAVICTVNSNSDSSLRYEYQREAAYYNLLDSATRGLKEFASYTVDPRNPVYFNTQVPRFAVFRPGPLNLFATGQSDLFLQQYIISSRTDYRQQKEEAVNGLQLMYGKLDVVFIIVFLFPLIIIAFNYNVLSSEKEEGTLKILLSQNAGLRQIVFAKLLVSFLFSLILLSAPVIALWIAGTGFVNTLPAVGVYLLICSLYSIFWHLLCGFINSKLKSSAYNATVLVGSWLLFTIILPTIFNLATDSVHPVPSRTKFITEYRQTMNAIEQDSNSAVLDRFFFDHPELVKEDTTGNIKNRANIFYKAYHVKHDKTQKALHPLYEDHSRQLQSANRFSSRLGFLTPAIITNQSMLLMSGQSSTQYLHFNRKIEEWRKPYLQFILNKLLVDEDVSREETVQWKSFQYVPYDYSRELLINTGMLMLYNVVLLVLLISSLKKATIL